MKEPRDARRGAHFRYITIDGCDPQQTSKKSGTLNPKWEESSAPVWARLFYPTSDFRL